MKKTKGFLFYEKGAKDEQLKARSRYDFHIVDAVFSPSVRKVQILFAVKNPANRKSVFFLEEFAPWSKNFREFLDRAIYTLECRTMRKVDLSDFIDLCFSAELMDSNDNFIINLKSILPIESTRSGTFHRCAKHYYLS